MLFYNGRHGLMSLSFQAQIALCRRAAIKYTRSAGGVARKQATVLEAMPAPGNPFHLAIPVHSIPEARKFYGGILGLKEGRRAGDKWQDYSLYGHQVVCHYVGGEYRCNDYYNPVDGDEGNSTI